MGLIEKLAKEDSYEENNTVIRLANNNDFIPTMIGSIIKGNCNVNHETLKRLGILE